MSEHEDFFKCSDCRDNYCCPVSEDSDACGLFFPKKKLMEKYQKFLKKDKENKQ